MRLLRERWTGVVYGLATAGAVLYGVFRAIRLRWVCDDAFITFRYADNWVGGLGPVYNAGERVEGYTHFLWLCMIAVGRRLGADPVAVAQTMGVAAFCALILLCAWIAHALSGRQRAYVPMAALALALHYDMAVWATGGLETALFALFVGLGFAALVLGPAERRFRLATAGLAFALGILTRPDGIIPAAVAFAYVAVEAVASRRPVRRAILEYAAFPTLLLLPYLAWKLSYYGGVLPNTYYAKSGGETWFGQGFLYIGLYVRAYLSSFVFALAIPSLFFAIRRGTWKDDPRDRAVVLSTAIVVAYLVLFVAKVGGDFMYARFVLPVVPLIYLTGEIGIRRVLDRRPILLVLLLIAVPALVFSERGRRDALYDDTEGNPRARFGPSGITDEHAYYTRVEGGGRNMIETYRVVGESLARYFEGTNVRVLLGGQASLGYYGRFAYCLEHWGLTDAYIAHLPVGRRSRPGHEKTAPLEYLTQKGIHFEFMKRPYRTEPYRSVYFRVEDGRIRGELFRWDRALMRHLRERFPEEVTFVDFEAWLDDWLRAMPGRPVDEVRRDYETLREFYFLHNDDPEREARIQAYLGGPGAP
jgi:hypothetical protein